MDLSDMMTDLLKDQAIKAISKKTGLDENSAKSMAGKALPMILWALKENLKDENKKKWLEKALEKHDGSILDNLDNIDLNDWEKILGHVFGDKKKEIEEKVGNKSVLAALAPIVLETLWKAKKESNLDLSNLLSDDWIVMNIARKFLDKDWDGQIMDDLLWMAMKKFM